MQTVPNLLYSSIHKFSRFLPLHIKVHKEINTRLLIRMTSTNQNASSPKANKVWDTVIKSENDTRVYRGIELKNGLRALLISDPVTDKSAACMDVYIGSMSEPNDLPGLAHFCEHMLFLGTEKYPAENEYQRFVSEHGGSTNASTCPEHTNYFFDVSPPHLSGALDRFAQFFLKPLFTEAATEREVKAVHSEHEKNLMSDMWRLMQLDRSLSDDKHPYNRFSTGSKVTLSEEPAARGVDVRASLLDFHRKFYSANIMSLCILGKESLDQLEEMTESLFSGVENRSISIPSWKTSPWTDEFLKHKIHVVPVKDLRALHIMWPIPDYMEQYKANPEGYVSHLIGHESAGSLLSELKKRGWVNSLVAGLSTGARGFGSFVVNVDLTETAMDHVDDITELIFQYLNMLREAGPLEWVYDEDKDLKAMRFRFKDKENPHSYASSIARIARDFPMEEVLCNRHLMTEFNPELIKELMTYLTPDNCRIVLMAKQYEDKCTEKEKWYRTAYCNEAIPDEVIQRWHNCGTHPNLHIPKKNDYIPTDFSLKLADGEKVSEVPDLLVDGDLTRIWFKQDDYYKLPKAHINVNFSIPISTLDPLSTCLTSMFIHVFNDAINEVAYDAMLAGLTFDISRNNGGFKITLSGYNHKLGVLLAEMTQRMCDLEIDPSRFECLRESSERALRNFAMNQPYQQAVYYMSFLLTENQWLNKELLDAMPDVTVEALERFIPQIFSHVFIEALVYGNVTKQEAIACIEQLEKTLKEKMNVKPALPNQIALNRDVMLPTGSWHVFQRLNEYHPTSSLEVYLQCPEQSTHTNMVLQLFAQIVSEPCFTVLRTEEQLGYIVNSGPRMSNLLQGLRVIVQSTKRPDFLETRVEAFLEKLEETLREMPEDEFQRHVQALYDVLTEKPKSMGKQKGRYWGEISCRHYNFKRDQIEPEHLKTLKKDDVIDFYKTYIAPSSTQRKRLTVHILSQSAHGEALPALEENYQGSVIEDPLGFKYALPLSALAKPAIPVGRGAAKL